MAEQKNLMPLMLGGNPHPRIGITPEHKKRLSELRGVEKQIKYLNPTVRVLHSTKVGFQQLTINTF